MTNKELAGQVEKLTKVVEDLRLQVVALTRKIEGVVETEDGPRWMYDCQNCDEWRGWGCGDSDDPAKCEALPMHHDCVVEE